MQGDCLELMKDVPDGSVDLILCDLPYGLTESEWDVPIPFAPLWREYLRICKPNAAIVLFSQMPFSVDLVNSQRKLFRYEWIYQKTKAVGFFNANKMPLKTHENILVFYRKLPTYNPQYTYGKPYERNQHFSTTAYLGTKNGYRRTPTKSEDGRRYPVDIIKFDNTNMRFGHAAQKPVDLCEYLIRTYTNEGETVLDNCMGSGSTGVACVNTGRDFIGMELDPGYFETAKRRIETAQEKRFDDTAQVRIAF